MLEITRASRLVNERQPGETVAAMLAKLGERAGRTAFRVVVGGIAFKGRPETDDLRGSMSLHVIDELAARDDVDEIRVFDPVVARADLEALPQDVTVYGDFSEACEGADLVIIANNHPAFAKIDVEQIASSLAEGGFIYDYWSNLEQQPAEVLSGRYFTVGNLVGRHK